VSSMGKDYTYTNLSDHYPVVAGHDVRHTVDKRTGTLSSMVHRGRELLRSGPELDAWRPPISNERWDWGTAEGKLWSARGLDRLRTTVEAVDLTRSHDGAVTVTVRSTVAAPDVTDASFGQIIDYAFDGSGAVRVRQRVEPRGTVRTLPYLPALGLRLAVPQRYDHLRWYGRGPQESVNDRRDGTPVGVWSAPVEKGAGPYLRPQAHGNHTEVRWAALTDGRTGGLLISAPPGGTFDTSVSAHDDLDRAAYPHLLRRDQDWHTLRLDHAVSGVGDTPNPVRPEYRVRADRSVDHTLTIRPLAPEEAARLR
ncbi:beta-galactosidase small subunit, partial [Streptomyces sp. URMC 123]|uniref:beta-galactosidase small subunit n=1 Tax=Streptomyces sp. URMC 123 TaxID=3423403 RepID=UPI003F1E40EA